MIARGCRWWQDVTVGTVPITLRNRACVWKYLCRLACTYLGSTILLFLRNSGNTDRILSMALRSDEIDNWKRSITDKIYDKYWDNISTFYLARGKRSIVDIYENIQTVLLCFKFMLGKHWESKNRFIFFSCREEFDRRFLSLFIERTSKSNSSIVLYFYQPDDDEFGFPTARKFYLEEKQYYVVKKRCGARSRAKMIAWFRQGLEGV